MKTKTLLSLSHAKGAEDAELQANYAAAEVVAGYARQRAQRQTDDEDDKTLSQGYDKTHKCAFGAHYLALSLAISLYLAKRKICAVYLQYQTLTCEA